MKKCNYFNRPILNFFYIIVGSILIFGFINGSSIDTITDSKSDITTQTTPSQVEYSFEVIKVGSAGEAICADSKPIKMSIGWSISLFGFNFSITIHEWEYVCDPARVEDNLGRI